MTFSHSHIEVFFYIWDIRFSFNISIIS